MILSDKISGNKTKLKLPEPDMGELFARCEVVINGQKLKAYYHPKLGWMTINFCPIDNIESWKYAD